ncbi:hypothetical protein [Haloechinothrix sp. LS1_15]|uniref:hypothetical protein n=1 Tax=Haloechinothrix sp. LS1_15 TaxID=2652248 RepID=UPI0029455FA2|nr:hypothetical protein [Haloechinothrix sp. LS1_15]MDV6012724.1 hypothetical protein [Haloechinothrix sp. LS1_15]
MLLGGGLLIGIAVGAAVGGWWLLGGLLLAGAVAAVSVWFDRPAWPEMRVAAAIGLAALLASTFARYLAPDHETLAGLAVLLVAAAITAMDPPVPRPVSWTLTATLAVAAVAFVAVCVAVAPVPSAGASPETELAAAGQAWLPAFLAVPASAAVMFGLFTVTTPVRRRAIPLLRVAGSTAVAVAVSAAALYQLGPHRLGLSPVPVRDALVAADAAALTGMLHGVVVLATVPGAVVALRIAADGLVATPLPGAAAAGSRVALPAVVAALMASLLTPVTALLLASGVAVVGVAAGWVYPRGRGDRRAATNGLS